MSEPFIYRASELGACRKYLVAKRLGYDQLDPPESLATIFAEGDLHEQAVVDSFLSGGTKVFDRQEEVNLPVTGSVIVQGHIDGKIDMGVIHLLEIKSMSDAAFKEFQRLGWDTPGLIQRYKWQVSAYMLATCLPLSFVVKNRNNGTLHSVIQPDPFYTLADIRGRILWVEAEAKTGLPLECDNPIYPCPYYYLHNDEVEVMADDEIDSLAIGYRRAVEEYNKWEQIKKQEYSKLMAGMGDREKVKTGRVSVTRYETTYKGWDTEAMERDGVVDKYRTERKREMMRVKVVEDEANRE